MLQFNDAGPVGKAGKFVFWMKSSKTVVQQALHLLAAKVKDAEVKLICILF